MKPLAQIRYFFGAKICPVCGSKNVIVRGFSGVNQRFHCQDCGALVNRDP